jgi:ATP-dependent helicase HrpB
MGSVVEASWIPWREVVTRRFDAERERVVALEERVCGALVARSTPTTCPLDDETAALLAAAASDRLERALTLDAKAVVLLRDRLAFLGRHAPELGLPVADDAQLAAWLPSWCLGLRTFAQTRALDVAALIRATMPWSLQQVLDREAPVRLTLSNGREVTVRYDGVSDSGEPRPVIAVRIQHVFGVHTTPMVAHGRVPVQMHLLAPNMRPQQVTTDLASFWRETYPEVRKTLRGRYPKHAWPEDPLGGG